MLAKYTHDDRRQAENTDLHRQQVMNNTKVVFTDTSEELGFRLRLAGREENTEILFFQPYSLYASS